MFSTPKARMTRNPVLRTTPATSMRVWRRNWWGPEMASTGWGLTAGSVGRTSPAVSAASDASGSFTFAVPLPRRHGQRRPPRRSLTVSENRV